MAETSGVTSDRYVSAQLLAAIKASGRTKSAIAAAVAEAIGCSAGTVAALLIPGYRVPHANGCNSILAALCKQIGFPYSRALTTTRTATRPPAPRGPAATIEARFQAARARIRAERRRLTPEGMHRQAPSGLSATACSFGNLLFSLAIF